MSDSIALRLVRLALPVVGLNLLGVAGLFIDTAMCSRLPEKAVALAALGYAGQLVFLATVPMMGLTIGAVALVARAHGAGDRERVGHVVAAATRLTVLIGAVVAVFGNLAAIPVLRALGASEEVASVAAAYLVPVLGGSVFYYLLMLYAAALRGVGAMSLPFVVGVGWNALNVVFNYALIYGNFGAPRLGVVGAGTSTVLAQAIGVLVLGASLSRGAIPAMPFAPFARVPDRRLARELVTLGAPAALDALILNLGFLALIYLLGRFGGDAVAAHGIGLRVQNIAFVPALGLAQAGGALVGNALGAGRPDEARTVTRAALAISTLGMAVLGGLLAALAGTIAARAFAAIPGTELHRLATTWMRVLGLGMPLVGAHLALIGTLRGSGATATSLRINLAGTGLAQLPLGLVLGIVLGLGPLGVWLSLPLSYVAKLALSYAAYARGEWARVGARA